MDYTTISRACFIFELSTINNYPLSNYLDGLTVGYLQGLRYCSHSSVEIELINILIGLNVKTHSIEGGFIFDERETKF